MSERPAPAAELGPTSLGILRILSSWRRLSGRELERKSIVSENSCMALSINRRQFLARSSAAGAALGLGSFALVSQHDARPGWSANDVVRAACIGLRGKGNHHIHGLESVDGVEVVALCDVDRSVLVARAAQLEKRSGRHVKQFSDYRRLIEEGHFSSALCHLGNMVHDLGRPVPFDPATETIPGDEEANALLWRRYRKPYVVPAIVL